MDAPRQPLPHPLRLLPREKERPRSTVRIQWIPSVVCMPRNWPRWKHNGSVNWKNNVLDVADLWRLQMDEGQEMCLLHPQEPHPRHAPRGLPRVRIQPNLLTDTVCDESLVEPAMYRPENPLLDIPAAATFNLRNVTLAPHPVTKSATFVKKTKITLSKKTDVNILDTASTLMTEA